jgi:hypothetical protein
MRFFHIHQRKSDALVSSRLVWNNHDRLVCGCSYKAPRPDNVRNARSYPLSRNHSSLLLSLHCHLTLALDLPKCKTQTSTVPEFIDSSCTSVVRIFIQWEKGVKSQGSRLESQKENILLYPFHSVVLELNLGCPVQSGFNLHYIC